MFASDYPKRLALAALLLLAALALFPAAAGAI